MTFDIQAALASHYIAEPAASTALPYADGVLFVEVLDGSKLRKGTRKVAQARLIEKEIQKLLPLNRISSYWLFHATTDAGDNGLAAVGQAVADALS